MQEENKKQEDPVVNDQYQAQTSPDEKETANDSVLEDDFDEQDYKDAEDELLEDQIREEKEKRKAARKQERDKALEEFKDHPFQSLWNIIYTVIDAVSDLAGVVFRNLLFNSREKIAITRSAREKEMKQNLKDLRDEKDKSEKKRNEPGRTERKNERSEKVKNNRETRADQKEPESKETDASKSECSRDELDPYYQDAFKDYILGEALHADSSMGKPLAMMGLKSSHSQDGKYICLFKQKEKSYIKAGYISVAAIMKNRDFSSLMKTLYAKEKEQLDHKITPDKDFTLKIESASKALLVGMSTLATAQDQGLVASVKVPIGDSIVKMSIDRIGDGNMQLLINDKEVGYTFPESSIDAEHYTDHIQTLTTVLEPIIEHDMQKEITIGDDISQITIVKDVNNIANIRCTVNGKQHDFEDFSFRTARDVDKLTDMMKSAGFVLQGADMPDAEDIAYAVATAVNPNMRAAIIENESGEKYKTTGYPLEAAVERAHVEVTKDEKGHAQLGMISKENGERIITPVGEPITFDANTILRNATMLRLEHQNLIEDSTSDLEYKPTPIIQRGMTMNLSKKIMENDALFAEANAQLFDGGVLDGNPVQVETPEQQTEPSQQRDIAEEPAR